MNDLAATAPIGAEGLAVLPFGNGAERMFQNKEMHCSFNGIDFNTHHRQHIVRAVQEGIVFSMKYGIDIMQEMGISVKVIHAGFANMFMSPLFRDTLASVTEATIELYDTDGSVGSAKGAGMGIGYYKDHAEAFATLEKKQVIEPDTIHGTAYKAAYEHWKQCLNK
jgi:xylulokinase